MTMLDRMRRHKNWLKWSLAIVVRRVRPSLHPQLPARRGPAAPSPRRTVTSSHRSRARRSRSASSAASTSSRCRPTAAAYGGNIDEQLLKQLGIDQRILQQLIEEEAALAEATVSGSRRATRKCARGSSPSRRSRRTASSSATALPAAAADADPAADARASSRKQSAAA